MDSRSDSTLRMSLSALVAAALLCVFGPAAVAQDAEWAPAKLGTRFVAAGGGYVDVAAVNGSMVETLNSRQQRGRWHAMFGLGVTLDDRNRPLIESLWPLSVGKSVEFTSFASDGAWEQKLTVVRTEILTLEMGPTQTIVVERHERGFGGTGVGFEGITTHCYSPQYGFVLKQDFRQIQGGANRVPRREISRVVKPQ